MRFSQQITAYTQSCRDEYLRDLAALIAIPSVSEELFQASEEAPFGIHCVAALDKMMELCRQYGLRTRIIGNVIGIAEYGEGPRELDIMAHLDVQPAGPGWMTDPFIMTQESGRVYGRGVSDDKGPALAALYAVRALRETGIPLMKTVRLVFGTGEEYGISDVQYYTSAEPAPPFMFTPDSSFPVVNTGKAGYMATLSASFDPGDDKPCVISLRGGENRGAVPGECTAEIAGLPRRILDEAITKARTRTGLLFDLEYLGGKAILKCQGVSTHAVKADQGKSALTAMLELVCGLPLTPSEGFSGLKRFSGLFPHDDVAGRKNGLSFSDDISGGTLYNIGIFHYTANALEAQLRATLPATAGEESFRALFGAAAAQAGLSISGERFSPGRHVPLEDPYLSRLLASYEHHTGKAAYGIASGGGNYSHYFPHGVAFGCEPHGVDTHMHGAQEYVEIDDMLMSIRIFSQAIVEICG